MNKLIFIFFSFVILHTNGQTNNPEAVSILQKLNNKIKTSTGTKINFTLSSVSSKGEPLATKNIELKMKGNCYLLNDEQAKIICDGKNIYNYDGERTISKSAVEDGNQDLNPQKIFSGNYESEFIINLESKKGNIAHIILMPKDKRKNVSQIKIELNISKLTLNKAIFYDKANNSTILKVKSLEYNYPLSDKLFIFNKNNYPKNVEIFD